MTETENNVDKLFPVTDKVRQDLATIKRGSDTLLIESELEQKLARSYATGKPLRVKLGLDPTAPDIHIGHTVVLNKLRQMQDMGHTVIFLVGDFTATIGDPSGRNVTRPPLTHEQVMENAQTYLAQAGLILDKDKTEIRYNSEWCDKLTSRDMISLCSRYTLARLLERDDFAKRYAANAPIAMHELIYPLMQGYDSVALRSDLELGGSDQRFNLLVGRELQRQYSQEPQCILTMPLLVGLDGVVKMSKSKHNYIGITDSASDMFGKVMSISDSLMWDWYDLLSLRSNAEIDDLKKQCESGRNPKDAKVMLAKEIVARFHSQREADEAEEEFARRFKAGAVPDHIAEVSVACDAEGIQVAKMLKEAQMVKSVADGNRHIAQNAVRINGERITDRNLKLKPGVYTVQVGKLRWARVTLG